VEKMNMEIFISLKKVRKFLIVKMDQL